MATLLFFLTVQNKVGNTCSFLVQNFKQMLKKTYLSFVSRNKQFRIKKVHTFSNTQEKIRKYLEIFKKRMLKKHLKKIVYIFLKNFFKNL